MCCLSVPMPPMPVMPPMPPVNNEGAPAPFPGELKPIIDTCKHQGKNIIPSPIISPHRLAYCTFTSGNYSANFLNEFPSKMVDLIGIYFTCFSSLQQPPMPPMPAFGSCSNGAAPFPGPDGMAQVRGAQDQVALYIFIKCLRLSLRLSLSHPFFALQAKAWTSSVAGVRTGIELLPVWLPLRHDRILLPRHGASSSSRHGKLPF